MCLRLVACFRRTFLGYAVILLFGTSLARATLIEELPLSHLAVWTEDQFGEIATSYNWATETWAIAAPWSSPFFSYFAPDGTLSGNIDETGNYYLSAHVDHNGNVLGGTYSLVLESATLGIHSPESFFSGTILGSRPNSGTGVGQLVATVDYLNPVLANFVQHPDFAILSFIGVAFGPLPDPTFPDFNPWNQEPVHGPYSLNVIQPDIFLHAKVSEPGTLSLIGAGLLALGWFRSRRRSA